MTVTATMTTAPAAPPRKWDLIVRLTHWSIAGAVLANALVTEEGSSAHVWVGYGLAAILGIRLLWGLVGPRAARFASFPPSPARAWGHLRDIVVGRATTHASHNPLGALMVYAIWGTLAVIIASGIGMAGLPDSPRAAPAVSASVAAVSDDDDDDRGGERHGERGGERDEGPLGEIHETAVNLLYALILLHIAGVVFESRRSGRQIVMAMLPGAR